MFSNKMLVLPFLYVLVLAVESYTGGGGARSYNYNMSNASDLRRLYNSAVYKAERMKRPLDGTSVGIGHSGVRVTLGDGSRWIVHKVDGFGLTSQTVVVNARWMSDDWVRVETKDFMGSKTVSDFVKAAGTDYSFFYKFA